VLVRAVPALLEGAAPASLLADLAAELAGWDGAAALEARLGVEEMAALLRAMEATPLAGTCSHGRPTYLRLGRGELERLFGRR
jgi:DNA mismatch repair protein MutL